MYSDYLKLESRYINNDLILNFYGLETSKNVLLSDNENYKIFFISGYVYLNAEVILQNFKNPTGVFLVNDNELLLSNNHKIITYKLNDNTNYNKPKEYFHSSKQESISLLGLDDKGLIYFIINKNY